MVNTLPGTYLGIYQGIYHFASNLGGKTGKYPGKYLGTYLESICGYLREGFYVIPTIKYEKSSNFFKIWTKMGNNQLTMLVKR